MYYYEGEEIGTVEDAKEAILASNVLTRELIMEYVFTFDEEHAKDVICSVALGNYSTDRASMVDDALTYLSDMWLDHGGWNQVKGECEALGDFEDENWVCLE